MNDCPSTADPCPPDLDDVIVRLADQQTALSRYIDRRWSDLDDVHLARLLSIHGQNAARLGHLLRDWRAIHGEPLDPLQQAMDEALDRAGVVLGIDLGSSDPLDAPAYPPIDIDDIIADLDGKCTRLARHLDRCLQDGDDDRFPRLAALYSRNTAHLGRLFRVRRALYLRTPEELEALIASMLDASAGESEEVHNAPQP